MRKKIIEIGRLEGIKKISQLALCLLIRDARVIRGAITP